MVSSSCFIHLLSLFGPFTKDICTCGYQLLKPEKKRTLQSCIMCGR